MACFGVMLLLITPLDGIVNVVAGSGFEPDAVGLRSEAPAALGDAPVCYHYTIPAKELGEPLESNQDFSICALRAS